MRQFEGDFDHPVVGAGSANCTVADPEAVDGILASSLLAAINELCHRSLIGRIDGWTLQPNCAAAAARSAPW